ncbi:MAG: type VII secretion protein EssC [Lachnospiraceae bacterium]|nr:type VII secretion protein EssC [Lachnospiraceae bacterium]
MSVVLSVYTSSAFRDYLLPAVNNSNYELILKDNVFALEEDVVLKLDIIDGLWSLLGSEYYRFAEGHNERRPLTDGDIFNIETVAKESISCMVRETTQSFTAFEKYDLTNVLQLTIGNTEENDFQYQCANFVSKHHATLQRAERGFAIRDTSLNGTFVNYIKINSSQPLRVGDCINIFGLKIVYLGTAIAVSSIDGAELKVNAKLDRIDPKEANAEVEKDEKEQFRFHRAPRYYTNPENESIEIEAPPALKTVAKKPIWMTIGPSFTMAIPMLLGSIVAIMSAKSSGGEASIYMFTGIFTAISSALVGAFWAITNIRYAGKESLKEEKNRQEAYGAYLAERENLVKEKYTKYSEMLHQIYPDAEAVSNYDQESKALWNRNRRHDDFLCPRIGLGDMEFPVEIAIPKEKFSLLTDELADKPKEIKSRYNYLRNVPIKLDLSVNRLFGVVGGKDKLGCYSVVRALVAQIAACNCYTDVKIVLLYDKAHDDGAWEYVYWLPHVWSEDKKTRYIASNKTETSEVLYELLQIFRMRTEAERDKKNAIPRPFYLMIIANPELLDGEPIAKYILNGEPCCGLTTFLLTDSEENLPNECENIIQSNDHEAVIYNLNNEKKQSVILDQVSSENLEKFARRILSIKVNETETGSDVPGSMTFFEMYNANKLSDFGVIENWKKNRTYETMRAMVGVKAGGAPCYLDIHEKYHGPHGLVAGTTGSGKSETLQTYMLSLALNFSPEDIGFFIIDFKGGGMSGLFHGLPHLIGSISNLSGNQVRRAMISIKSENKRRQRIFNENNVNNINLYTKLYKNGEAKTPLPHMFIIVDEFAELKREEPEFMKELISVAQVGRSLGVHLILSTQKPSGTVDDNIWSNSKFRLCLRVQDKQDSNDMLHKADAAYITQAGRGYLQVGSDEVYELFQSGYSGAFYDENVEGAKSEVASMITTHGKTSLIGNHQKRLKQELAKRNWIKELVMSVAEATNICEQGIEEFAHNERRIDYVMDSLERHQITYGKTDYNTKRIDALIITVKNILDENIDISIDEIVDKVISFSEQTGVKLPEEKKKTQLDAVVEYLADVAKKEGYSKQMQLWMPPLPDMLYFDKVQNDEKLIFDGKQWREHTQWNLKTILGITDDPENQAQLPLEVDLIESGNIAVLGAVTSGKSTFIQTLVYGLITSHVPSWVNFYAIDFSSRMLSCFSTAPHFGDVLYEDDAEKIEKLFFMLDKIIAERKKMLNGGNYVQYIKVNGIKLPLIVVLIDNIGAFREKTEGKYDDNLTRIMKEGISYGVQFVVAASGFSSSEINTKMADCFKTTFALQLNDKYAYCDALRTNQVDILPENNVKGRGLTKTGASVLEFQTALVTNATDDYRRLEEVEAMCLRMLDVWKGEKAKTIPVIPEKPVWTSFEEQDAYKRMLATRRYLPIGWDTNSAEVYGFDLTKTFVQLVSGKAKTGKTMMQKAVMCSAKNMGARIIVIEHSSDSLKLFAEKMGAEYITSISEQADFFSNNLNLIKERNQKKKAMELMGKDDIEIFNEMSSEQPIFVVISDIVEFVKTVSKNEIGVVDISAFVKNVFDKGSLLNIYFFIGINPDTIAAVLGNEIFTAITAYHEGMHFGGMVENIRYMDFSNFVYNERNKVRKTGVAMLPVANDERTKEVVIPLVKR